MVMAPEVTRHVGNELADWFNTKLTKRNKIWQGQNRLQSEDRMRSQAGEGANGSPRKSAVGLRPGLSDLLRQEILKLLEKKDQVEIKRHINTHDTELTRVMQSLPKMLQ